MKNYFTFMRYFLLYIALLKEIINRRDPYSKNSVLVNGIYSYKKSTLFQSSSGIYRALKKDFPNWLHFVNQVSIKAIKKEFYQKIEYKK